MTTTGEFEVRYRGGRWLRVGRFIIGVRPRQTVTGRVTAWGVSMRWRRLSGEVNWKVGK